MKKNKFLARLLTLAVCLGAMAMLLDACKISGEQEENTMTFEPRAGEVYVFASAKFAAPAAFTQNGQSVNFAIDDDGSAFFLRLAFATSAVCNSPEDQSVELRPDGSISLVCLSAPENGQQRGSWSFRNNNTTLNLVVPSNESPTGEFGFNSDALSFSATQMRTRFTVPAQVDLDQPADPTNIQLILLDIIFERRNG